MGRQNIEGWLGAKLNTNKEQRLYKVDETALLAGFINKPGEHQKINGSPSFLFYQPGVYKTDVNGNTSVEFTTQTTFPETGNVIIEVNPSATEKFEVLLRKPYWAGDFEISVNGEKETVKIRSLSL